MAHHAGSLEGKNSKWQREPLEVRSMYHVEKQVHISIWDEEPPHGEMCRELQTPACSVGDQLSVPCDGPAHPASEVTVPNVPGRGGLCKLGPRCLRQLSSPLISNSQGQIHSRKLGASWRFIGICRSLEKSYN